MGAPVMPGRGRGTGAIRLATLLLALLGCAGLALLIGISPAHASVCAAQDDYTGAANGSWALKTNWSTGSAPTSTETACIPAGDGTITIAAKVKAEAKTVLAQSALLIAAEGSLAVSETTIGEAAGSTFDGLTVEGLLSTAGSWLFMNGTVLVKGEIKTTSVKPNEDVARLLTGTITGAGTFDIGFQNIGGTMEPGGPGTVGQMHFKMLSDQAEGGTLILDIASKSSFDEISSESNFGWRGKLVVNLLGGYSPVVGEGWEFMSKGPGNFVEFEAIEPAGYRALSVSGGAMVEAIQRPPTAVTEPATEVTPTTAIVNAMIDPNNESVTSCEFEYGTTTSYGSTTGCGGIAFHGNGFVPTDGLLTGLTPGVIYHFRVKAGNSTGSNTGGDESFVTLPAAGSGGGTTPPGGGSNTTPTPGTATTATTSQAATEDLRLGCSKSQLVLNDAYIHGSRVILLGSAARSLAGKKVTILFNEKKPVATATVQADGDFATTAALPPAKIRDSLTTRYSAEIGSVRSLHLKLVRRLLLEPPTAGGDTVTLTGRVTKPLTKPIAPIIVEQQLECGKTTIAKQFTPPASGVFHVTLTVPSGTTAAIYTLKSKVAANAHALAKGFKTYSLPLPVAIG
ncbi:MAG TPA: hypothetical protein VH061_15135 [Solirubrobacteraceae bacterium]|jgi:hypothetical protein|nr:hypothetical protein [Solirubrobacteraceae bacterium]